MTPEEQRIKIAEACGWVRGYSGDLQWVNDPNGIRIGWSSIRNVADQALPDYLNDLNAMHEAEKFLNHDQDLDYSESLEVVVQGKFNCNNGEDMRRLRSATASQRAEAFLRTLNLWTE